MVRAFQLFLLSSFLIGTPITLSADLDLNPVMLFKCWRALKKLNTISTPTVPTKISKQTGNKTNQVPTFTKLNPKTVATLFEDTSPGVPKLVNGLSYRSVDGTPKVLFWPEMTHREAVETIIQSELTAIKNYLSNPKTQKLQMLLEAKENLQYLLEKLHSNSDIPQEITERFFGFKINATKAPLSSEIKVNSIDFNSTFTGKSPTGSSFGWAEEFQTMLDAISHSIHPKYRPEFYRIDQSLLDSLWIAPDLKAPRGSKIIGFSED
ncbi:MAG: hypothetical protein ACKN9V_01750 [Pseudomonadota bacterium]